MSTNIHIIRTKNSSLAVDPSQFYGPGLWSEALEERRRAIEELNKSLMELEPHETTWMKRYHILLAQGLQLRPRLRPGWQPSWTYPGGNALMSEDGEILDVSSCSS